MHGQRSVVFGATGNVGWGAAKAFLRAGAEVLLPTRSSEGAQRLQEELSAEGQVKALVVDVSEPGGADTLTREVERRFGAPDHVFASMGPWWQKGPIIEQDADEYRQVMSASLDCQVYAAQGLLPLMVDRGGSYTLVTGQGGHLTIPNTGLLVIAVSGVFGLSRMLRAELADRNVRVNELLIAARVERTPRKGVVPAEALGQSALQLATSAVKGRVLRFDRPEQFTTDLEKAASM